jgi:hypothetical protein
MSQLGHERRIRHVRNIFGSPPKADVGADIDLRREVPLSAIHRVAAKSIATGLKVRFLSVTIAIDEG